jgi:hypothetical protein
VVGLVAAGLSLPRLEAAFSQAAGQHATVRRAIATASLSVALIVAILLSLDATISGLALLIYFGLALAGDGLWRLWAARAPRPVEAARPALLPLQPGARLRLAAYFDNTSYAPWLIAALLLLVVAAFNFTVGRGPNAERLANWAYGFLFLGVGVALLQRLSWPRRTPGWLRQLASRLAPVGLGTLLIGIGFALERADQPPLELRPAYASVASYLAQWAQPDDVIMTRGLSVSLRCYGLRQTPIADLRPDDNLTAQIASAMAGHRRAFFVYSTGGAQDRRAERFALAMGGDLVHWRADLLAIEVYEVRPRIGLTTAPALNADFGPITVLSTAQLPEVRSGSALAVTLRVSLNEQAGRDYTAKLVLLDGAGQTVAVLEEPLLDQAGGRTSAWRIGDSVETDLLLAVPLGTPPLTYRLALEFWDKNDLTGLAVRNQPALSANRLLPLGTVQVVRPVDFPSDDPYETIPALFLAPLNRNWEGLRLLAYRPVSGSILPGDRLPLLFRWEALKDKPLARPLEIRLLAGTQVVASMETIAGGGYPIDKWQLGEQVLDWVSLPTLPEAAPGPAKVQLSLDGTDWIDLGTVVVAGIARTFTAPVPSHQLVAEFGGVAEMVGYNLKAAAAPGGPIALTLFWRATNPIPLQVHYKVFIHALTPDGTILAQSDTEPMDWTRPTTTWIKDEYLADTHSLSLPPEYAGRLAFRIGLYDADTLARVPVSGGDFIILPDELSIPSR